jgi:hypothetical protein
MLIFALGVRVDVLDRFLDARDLLGVLVGNLDAELFLEGHHQLDRVERVGAEVVDERCVRSHFFLVDASCSTMMLFTFSATAIQSSYVYMPPLTARTCP